MIALIQIEDIEIPIPLIEGHPDFSVFPSIKNVLSAEWEKQTALGQSIKIVSDSETFLVYSPNLTGLRDEISYGAKYPLIQDWYDGLPPRQRDPLQLAIANQNLEDIEYCLRPILPTDEATLKELIDLLAEFEVPISLNENIN